MSFETEEAPVSGELEIRSAFVDAGGIRTHYLSCGNTGKPPIILIHGGGAGATAMSNWQATLPSFTQNHHVIAPEMLGFGQTDKPEDIAYSQDERVAHLKAFLDVMELDSVPLVGNSMGGATSLGLAMKWPERVSELILMGSSGLHATITPSMAPILDYDFTIEGMRRLIDALTGPLYTASEDIIQLRHQGSLDPDVRRAYSRTMEWIKVSGGLAYAEEDIAKVKTRTLVVSGKEDIVSPMAHAIRFLELLDNSTGYFLPHIGHWVMIEAPEEFAEIVMGFVARGTGGNHAHT